MVKKDEYRRHIAERLAQVDDKKTLQSIYIFLLNQISSEKTIKTVERYLSNFFYDFIDQLPPEAIEAIEESKKPDAMKKLKSMDAVNRLTDRYFSYAQKQNFF